MGRAFALLEAGRLLEARRAVRPLEALRPEPLGLAYLLGLLCLAEGKGRQAVPHLSRAAGQTPGQMPPLLALARAQMQQQRWPEAAGAYKRLLAAAPDYAVGWREFADLFLQISKFAEALLPLWAATLLQPLNALLRNNLGIAARANGKLAFAADCFIAAVILEPGLAKSYANLAGLRRLGHHPASAIALRAIQIADRDAASHVELGQALRQEGEAAASLASFTRAAQLLPEQPEPLWLLAETLKQLGRDADAIPALQRILQLHPADRFGAGLALAQADSGPLPDRASAEHIRALYDQYAPSFEANLLQDLGYQAPQLLKQALERAGITPPLDVLDAGCGTGLMGQAIKPWAASLIGVDLSAKMAEQARARGIYDLVVTDDLLTWLHSHPATYDLVVAADVLIYLGDLHDVAAASFIALRSGGAFAFTVERCDDAPLRLLDNGRFAHSASHIAQVAADCGFTVELCEECSTRSEKNLAVPGLLCILRTS